MINSYGYNRKTLEEDTRILSAVKYHHEEVEKHGFFVIMTVLVGSENYDLDDENSDIDTFSFVFPRLNDIALAKEPEAGEFAVEDGICNYKDIRVALNLLRKASPNSIEYFTSKYKIYNPIFEPLLREYLDDNTRLWHMIHCNYSHMLYAMAGMAHQLTKRNMPAGKRYAHALRLQNMYYHFLNSVNAGAVLDMQPHSDRDLALLAKRDKDPDNEPAYNEGCTSIADWLDDKRKEFTLTEELKLKQQTGIALINTLQWRLFKTYLEEVNK